MTASVREKYIAPWALPKEKFPLHFVWFPDSVVRAIRMDLPPNLKFDSAFNIDRSDLDPRGVTLMKRHPWDYVTVFLCYDAIPSAAVTKEPIHVVLVGKGKQRTDATLAATIVRPRLELVSAPSEVELSDKVDPATLLVASLRQTGFGPVRLSTSATFKGRLMSEGGLLAREIAQLLLESGMIEREAKSKTKPGLEIGVADAFMEEVVKQIEELLHFESGEMIKALEEFGLEKIALILKEKGPAAVSNFMKAYVGTFLIDLILDTIASHPGEHADLAGGPTRALVGGMVDAIDVTVKYQDPAGNTYEEIKFTTAIKDARSKPIVTTLPINFKIEANLVSQL